MTQLHKKMMAHSLNKCVQNKKFEY